MKIKVLTGEKLLVRLLRLLRLYEAIGPLMLRKGPPSIVYQMGKVGSMSVFESLLCNGLNAFHTHRLHPRNENFSTWQEKVHAKMLYRTFVEQRRAVKYITLVREPVGRHLSLLFQTYNLITGKDIQNGKPDQAELQRLFLQQFVNRDRKDWFEIEMNAVLNVDIYKYPFSKAQGSQIIRKGDLEILVLKLETSDEVKAQAIREFLGVKDFKLYRRNVGSQKGYAKRYKEFLTQVQLPAEYLDRMYNSRLAKHFYSVDELERMQQKWTRNAYKEMTG